jgi:cytochrome c
MFKSSALRHACIALGVSVVLASIGLAHGRLATAAQIAAWDIDVRPDGAGLPSGRGSVHDGEAVFESKCASCHGTFGDSQEYMAIAGGIGSLATPNPQRTVGSKLDYATTLFDYINRAMPFNDSKTLKPDEVYAVTAYVLHLNDILPADAVLDRESLPDVKMPNRGNYTLAHGFGRLDGKPDVHNTACMKACETDVKILSELPAGFVEQFYGDISGNFRRYDTAAVFTSFAGGTTAEDLIARYGCVGCHSVDKKIIGPSFRDVAKRYTGDRQAPQSLLAKLKAGGSGRWGEIPMPSQVQVPDSDLDAIVRWILEMKP